MILPVTILVLVVIINLILTAIVVLHNNKNIARLSFSGVTFFISLWAYTNVQFQLTTSSDIAYSMAILSYIAVIGALSSVLMLSFIFPGALFLQTRFTKHYQKIVFIPAIALSILALSPGGILKEVDITTLPKKLSTSVGLYIFALYLFSTSLLILINFSRSFLQAKGVQKHQVRLILVGVGATIFFGVVFNLILPLLGNYSLVWLGPNFSIILVITIAYAIIKHRLFNIQIQAQKIINTLLPICISVVLTISLAYLLYEVLKVRPLYNAVTLLFFYTLTYRSFNHLFTKTRLSYLLFRKTYHYHESLRELARSATTYTDFEELIKKMQEVFLGKGMVEAFAFFVITNQETKSCHVMETHNINPAELAICANSVLHPFLHQELSAHREPLVIEELAYQTKPEHQELKSAFHPLGGGVCIPLFVSTDLAGLILLGPKANHSAYTSEDIALFKEVSVSLAVAVTKTLLFFHLKERIARLDRDNHNFETAIAELHRMKSEFLTIVNHQLNTPLSVMRGALSMIEEGDIPLTEIQGYVQGIAPKMDAFKSIVQEMLEAAEFEGSTASLRFEPVMIKTLIENTLASLGPLSEQYEAPLELFFPEKETRVKIMVDQPRTQHALEAIIRNAIVYGAHHPVSVNIRYGQKIIITVEDQGRGFDSEEAEHIGEKFYRGKGVNEYLVDGSGLGVYVAKKVIEASGGTLAWKSAGPGKGSVFTIELPTAAEFVQK